MLQAESRSLSSQVSKLTAQMASNEKAEARRGEGAVRLQARPCAVADTAQTVDHASDSMRTSIASCIGGRHSVLDCKCHKTGLLNALQHMQRFGGAITRSFCWRTLLGPPVHLMSVQCALPTHAYLVLSMALASQECQQRLWLQARVARLEEMLAEAQGKRRDDERSRVRSQHLWRCFPPVLTACCQTQTCARVLC